MLAPGSTVRLAFGLGHSVRRFSGRTVEVIDIGDLDDVIGRCLTVWDDELGEALVFESELDQEKESGDGQTS